MAVDLSDYTPSLRRAIEPPGQETFRAVADDALVGYLSDAFWEARLDGYLADWAADEDGIVTPLRGTADLPRELIALVVVYAAYKILTRRLMNMNTSFRAQAGPVEYEVQNSANLLTEMLKQLAMDKARIIEVIEVGDIQTSVYLIDAYATRLASPRLGYLPAGS